MYGYDVKITAEAGREKFCRSLERAGLQPVFLAGINRQPWGYGVPAEDLEIALKVLDADGIAVLGVQDLRLTVPTGILRK